MLCTLALGQAVAATGVWPRRAGIDGPDGASFGLGLQGRALQHDVWFSKRWMPVERSR